MSKERDCLDCKKITKKCIIEQYFARFLEQLEVRDNVDTSEMRKCLARHCFEFEKEAI